MLAQIAGGKPIRSSILRVLLQHVFNFLASTSVHDSKDKSLDCFVADYCSADVGRQCHRRTLGQCIGTAAHTEFFSMGDCCSHSRSVRELDISSQ